MVAPPFVPVPPPQVGPPPASLLGAARVLGYLSEGSIPVVTEDYQSPDYEDDVAQPSFAEQSPPDRAVPPDRQAWHRMGGVAYEQEPCTGGGSYDPCDPEPVEAQPFGDPVNVAGFPVQFGAYCSSLDGYTISRLPEVVARRLWVRQHYIVGREFWKGEQSQANGWNNPYLQNEATVNVLAYDLTTCGALAALEDGIANVCSGGAAVIHASPALATAWARDYQIFRPAGSPVAYTTGTGTPVITGPGYDGSGPDYTNPTEETTGYTWAYATGALDVRLSPAVTIGPTPYLSKTAQEIDKATNRVTVRVERLAQASWDECCHLAVQAELGDCSVVGGSAP